MSNLDCHEFHRLLEEAVEQKLPPRDDLRLHAAACDACRPEWEEYLILEEAIPRWCAAVPQVDLVEPVLAQLAFDEPESSAPPRDIRPLVTVSLNEKTSAPGARRSRVAYAVTAIAAMLAVGAFTAYSWRRPAGPQIVEAPLPKRPDNNSKPILKTEVVAPVEQPDSEFSVIAQDASSAYLELANDAAAAITEGAALLPSMYVVADAAPEDNGQKPSWFQDVGRNLEPLGDNLGNAIDFLLKAPPPEPAPAT